MTPNEMAAFALQNVQPLEDNIYGVTELLLT